MKHSGIINRDISAMIAMTGHFDRIVISDAGFPIPKGVACIDLSMWSNNPKVVDVLRLIGMELPVEQFWFAQEIKQSVAERERELLSIFPGAEAISLPHTEFKELAYGAVGVIRTGDFQPYGNVMVASGVAY